MRRVDLLVVLLRARRRYILLVLWWLVRPQGVGVYSRSKELNRAVLLKSPFHFNKPKHTLTIPSTFIKYSFIIPGSLNPSELKTALRVLSFYGPIISFKLCEDVWIKL